MKLVRRLLTVAVIALAVGAASPPSDEGNAILRFLGFVPCCKDQECDPTGCWLISDCDTDPDCRPN